MADIAVTFKTLIEDAPGAQWQALFEHLWPAYRSWFLRSGAVGRPSYLESRRALREHIRHTLHNARGHGLLELR